MPSPRGAHRVEPDGREKDEDPDHSIEALEDRGGTRSPEK